jgi:hypothetical protein
VAHSKKIAGCAKVGFGLLGGVGRAMTLARRMEELLLTDTTNEPSLTTASINYLFLSLFHMRVRANGPFNFEMHPI